MRTIVAFCAFLAGPAVAQAQDHVLIDGPFSLWEVLDTIASAHSVTVPGYEASAPYPSDRFKDETMITVTRKGVTVLAYRPKFYGSDRWQADATFSCGPQGTVDFTQLLFGSGQGQIPSDDATLHLQVMPYGQNDHRIPVTLVETLSDPRGLIRVHGRIPADHALWRGLKPTGNLQTQLIVNSQYERFAGGGDLSTFDTTLGPLLVACAGESGAMPRPTAAPAPALRLSLTGTPDEAAIKAALEAKVAQQMAVHDGLSDQCSTFKRDDNPLGAVACMMSGFGMASSRNMGMTIHGVSLDECVRSDDGVAYCRYRVNAEMRGSGMMGQVADLANLGMGLNGWSYGGFERIGETWSLIRTYEHCSWGTERINCTYRD